MIRLISVLLALTCCAAGAEDGTLEDRRARFELFNNCTPMDFVIEHLDADMANIGLTEDALTAAVESRLRAARVFESEPSMGAYLYVNVNTLDRESTHQTIVGYSIGVSFNKYLLDPRYDSSGMASTWNVGSIGRGGGAHILSNVSRHLDRFLMEYLRVNEEACTKRFAQARATGVKKEGTVPHERGSRQPSVSDL